MHESESFRLLNGWQRGFPLAPRPFAQIAAHCGLSEEEVIDRYAALRNEGLMDRIGPVFRPNSVGASTLAAMAVPEARLEEVADTVTACEGVNHNYERENRFNLWFVVACPSSEEVEQTVRHIERQTGLAVLRLPLVEEYHIDLGFDLTDLSVPRAARRTSACPILLDAEGKRLLKALEHGIPLVSQPYAALARASGLTESAVIARLHAWIDGGIVRRFGTVVRHRRLGYEANAMVVWDVPDEEVEHFGRLAAAERAVTLCYRRARVLPEWPYNLYCMLHGQKRARVLADIAELRASTGLGRFPSTVLFSRRCFAQRGARYGARLAHA
jgi:DNA-binding Lrp family transcriptional regulator